MFSVYFESYLIDTYRLNLAEFLDLIFGNVEVLKYVSCMSSRNFFTHKCFVSIEAAYKKM